MIQVQVLHQIFCLQGCPPIQNVQVRKRAQLRHNQNVIQMLIKAPTSWTQHAKNLIHVIRSFMFCYTMSHLHLNQDKSQEHPIILLCCFL